MEQMDSEILATHISFAAEHLKQQQLPSLTRYVGMEELAQAAIAHLMGAMFPDHIGNAEEDPSEEKKRAIELAHGYEALVHALEYVCKEQKTAEKTALSLIDLLPDIMSTLKTDLCAAYQGDPAAVSIDEVILTYPAFKAIAIYRIAHELYRMQVPLLPRVLTEYAHMLTGIDIHPGATIGRYFFIDHGTGVVIGETTTIGDHVKLYQNVTLGAKSFAANADGTLVKGIKRHPDIGSHVVVYAGATILGGKTVIGDHCVIGGNVWLDHSLAAHSTITIRAQEEQRSKMN